jgi:hypothetical protein
VKLASGFLGDLRLLFSGPCASIDCRDVLQINYLCTGSSVIELAVIDLDFDLVKEIRL